MNYFNGTLLYTSAGLKAAIPITDMDTGMGFTPKMVRVTAAKRLAVTENFGHISTGSGIPASQHCDSMFQDTTGGKSSSVDDVISEHWARIGGTVIAAQRIRLAAILPTAIQFEVMSPLAQAYPVYVEAWG